MTNKTKYEVQSKPPYLLGLLGLIPLVGFFVGIALFLYGVIKYKDRKLIIIGIACMLFTVIAYSSLFYYGFISQAGKKGWADMSQMQLNSLIKNVEYYKIENGHYPDSLQQLEKKDEFVFIEDPLKSVWDKNRNFNYKNLGDRYLLFSSGIDGIANTKDDIYPQVDTANKNIGWIKTEEK
ncbi:MAG: type II secretion system protein GspG [Ginsengibacter sp.]